MAAHDYYGSHPSYANTPAYPYQDEAMGRSQAPLPPLPSNSPFDDHHNYPYSHQTPSQSHTGSNQPLDDTDPFEDSSAIPLNGRRKHESQTSVTPMVAPLVDDDPFVRDAKPGRRRRREEEDGWFKGKITWVVFVLTLVQLAVFIAEIAKNAILTGSPIEIHPSFNPMIGPSPYVLINMGSRYQPCMHNMANVQNSSVAISWPCPNATSTTGDSVSCTLSELCGFSGVPNPVPGGSIDQKPSPNQWWRFILPIFIHAGIVHIGFNLLLQMTLGRDVEKLIGSLRFALVYFSAGIFGFVLGGNFAADGIASCGCSGSLFGILAITLLDLLYSWRTRPSPVKDLLFILVDVLIAFVLGLLPGLDNFSHIGGFLMGLVLGICLLRSPLAIARSRTSQDFTYAASQSKNSGGITASASTFFRQPLTTFRDRRGVWWVWWLVRVAALLGALIGFILLLKNFYQWRTTCSWCKYLSCLPITTGGTNWCDVGNLDFTSTNSTSAKRDLAFLFDAMY